MSSATGPGNEDAFSIHHGRIVLREMIPADVDDHVRWETVEIAWLDWDAPWEKEEDPDPSVVRRRWEQRFRESRLRTRRTTLEMCLEDGTHIGRVSLYRSRRSGAPAVGIGIRESAWWGQGLGLEAWRLWVAHVFEAFEYPTLHSETWSGNVRMIRLSERCGFREAGRVVGIRAVRGGTHDAVVHAVTRPEFEALHPELIASLRSRPEAARSDRRGGA